jgi:16S rRNA processing protein RimM
VLKTQGRRGEVAAELYTDFPERFEQRRKLFALEPQGSRRELELEEFWPHKGQLVLKFADVDSISDAELLVGCELQIPAGERAEVEAGTAYVSDLIGCIVWDGEREIGTVKDVQFGAGEAPMLIVTGRKEFEIPYAEAYLNSVDVGRKEIRMQLPEGMLEINAPLTDEEKRQQAGTKKRSPE